MCVSMCVSTDRCIEMAYADAYGYMCKSTDISIRIYVYLLYFLSEDPTAGARYGVYVYTCALYRMLPCDSHTEICVRLMCVGLTNDMSVNLHMIISIHDTQ